MRISTSMMHTLSLQSIQTQQEALIKTQTQLSTGKKILTPSDAPSDAMRVIERTQYIGRLEQYDRVISHAQGELDQQDTLLGQANDLLQSIRDQAVQLNNDSYTIRERRDAAASIRGQIKQLLDIANSQDTTGNYLFSGFKGDTQPFVVDASNRVVYLGDQGNRTLKIGEAQDVQMASSGDAIFMQIMSGNGTFETRPGNIHGTYDLNLTNPGPSLKTSVTPNTWTNALTGNLKAGQTPTTPAATHPGGKAQISPGTVVDPSQWDGGDYTLTFKVVTDQNTMQDKVYYIVKDASGNPVKDNLGTLATDESNYPIVDADPPTVDVSGNLTNQMYAYQSGQSISFKGIQFSVEDAPADGDTFTIRDSTQKSVFDILGDLADTLESYTGLPEELGSYHNRISNALSEIDQSMDTMVTERARVGIRSNGVQSVQLAYTSLTFVHQSNISKLRDTDYAEAASNLARQMQSLDAMQATYGKIKDLSLFNFI